MNPNKGKRTALIAVIIVLALLLAAAGGVIVHLLTRQPDAPPTPSASPTVPVDPEHTPAQSAPDPDGGETPGGEQKDPAGKVCSVTRETVDLNTEEGEYAFLYSGKDESGKVVWTYRTETGVAMQWGSVEELADTDSRICLYENGTVKALSKETGKILWENEEFKDAAILNTVFADEEQNLYIYCGGLTVIDSHGKTKAVIHHEYLNGDGVGWEFVNDDCLTVYGMDGLGADLVFRVDLDDYGTLTETVEDIVSENDYTQIYTYTKKDSSGKEMWTYQSGEYPVAELNTVEFLTVADGKVYLNENGTVIALNKDTGETVWQNPDYKGAMSAFCMDREGRLYLAGYYGPSLCVIDKDGSTVKKVDSFGDGYIWPVRLELQVDRELVITCTNGDMEEEALVIDLRDYSVKS